MNLRQKRVAFTRMVARLIDEADLLGFEIALNEVLRSQAAALANAKAGIGIKNSLHLVGLAVDVALYKDGHYLTRTEDYKPLGTWWTRQSTDGFRLCWGGNFMTLKDGSHFSVEHEGRK